MASARTVAVPCTWLPAQKYVIEPVAVKSAIESIRVHRERSHLDCSSLDTSGSCTPLADRRLGLIELPTQLVSGKNPTSDCHISPVHVGLRRATYTLLQKSCQGKFQRIS